MYIATLPPVLYFLLYIAACTVSYIVNACLQLYVGPTYDLMFLNINYVHVTI